MTADRPDLSDWIGRETRCCTDVLTARMVAEFEATLGPYAMAHGQAFVGMHWCLCPEIQPQSELGPDGHPAKGTTLPPVPLPRRMWAGGRVISHAPLTLGAEVTRRSVIKDIAWKSGRTGDLCFVAVGNEYKQDGALCVEEVHNIVYRNDGAIKPARSDAAEAQDFDHVWRVPITTTTLFRYSAMTFNGHRIHYDLRHATETEGYDDLVIHGPLQATLMLNLAAKALGQMPRQFDYRGLAPATGAQEMGFGAKMNDEGCTLVALNSQGRTTMRATATST